MLLLAPSPLEAAPDPVKQAARLFRQGEKLYEAGHFEKAVQAFLEANRLASHRATVFNIARCYENLANVAEALRYYEVLLKMTADVAEKMEIQQRMALIRRRAATGVLVTTEPPGARITVDAREQPEAQETPALIKLSPGAHVLQLRRPGHQLAVARVQVKPGQEQKVQVKLEPLPEPQPTSVPAPPCPEDGAAPCPEPGLRVDTERVRIRAHLLSTVNITDDTLLTAGPGIQLHATYRRLVLGVRVLVYIPPERDISDPPHDKQTYRRWIAEVDGGWAFGWRWLYFYVTGGLGVLIDRAISDGPDVQDFVREKFAFTWSIGGGMEVMATRWLSFGTALRFGMGHGYRVDMENQPKADADDTHHWPIGTFWMSVTFHL
jgi:hypothetical protein